MTAIIPRGRSAPIRSGGVVPADGSEQTGTGVWGMPGYVANSGLADRILLLAMIGGEIVQRVGVQMR